MKSLKNVEALEPGKTATFQFDPYYDEILLFPATFIPTSQDKLKVIDADKGLYELKRKKNVIEFEKHLKQRLLDKRKPWWPYTEFIDLKISISGPKKEVFYKDLDNYLKTIFDLFKGVVYDDDYKIMSVEADKAVVPQINGLMVFIKKRPSNNSYIFRSSPNPSDWPADAKRKVAEGGMCVVDSY